MRRPLRKVTFSFASLLLLTATTAAHLGAQSVRGRLLDADGVTGLGSAMIVLEHSDGTEVDRALSRDNGLFLLNAPVPGSYRLRAERIGYATTHSEYFDLAADETVTKNLVAAVEAITLEGIEAGGERQCTVRPEEGLAVTRVWDEARKALSAAAWTQDRGYYQYEMMNITRRLDPDGIRVLGEERSYNRGYMKAPYVSRPADSLVHGGFARITPRESLYWAPDAEVLLSDAFLDTHCFNLRTDAEAAPGLIGLAFEPVRGRPQPDIGGTLWLDPSTAQLKRLDYTYRNLNLPRTLITSGIGGSLEFEALPNGTWIVDSWRIRMPRAGMGTNRISGGGTAILEEIVVQGGDVVMVHDNQGGTVLEAELGGGIAGVVRDTLRKGLPNARVFVQGTGIESFTDSDGRFQLAGLDPGVYAVTFDHPYLEPYAYVPEPFEVEVLADSNTPAQISFTAPGIDRIREGMCGDVERPDTSEAGGGHELFEGHLIGRVTDPDGNPVPGAQVMILSLRENLRIASSGPTSSVAREQMTGSQVGLELERTGGGLIVTTNASGYYRSCWMPTDARLDVAVVTLVEGGDPTDVDDFERLSREEEAIVGREDKVARLDLRIRGN